ncbi:MAG: hypothetical protein ABIH89_00205 [Elusimicrobiota bacterium]
MIDSFTLTVLTIVAFTLITAFIRGRIKDKCLKDCINKNITYEDITGKRVWGRFSVETTGFELTYKELRKDSDGHFEKSFILYKSEYPNLRYLISYLDDLDVPELKKREKMLKKTYHPGFFKRVIRKITNMFKTIRDSMVEIINLFLGQAKKKTVMGRFSGTQDKYLSKVKDEYIGSVSNAYEPLLEKHIGHKVVLEILENDILNEYCGILKDYSAEFIEIIDVDFKSGTEGQIKKADLIVPRSTGLVRHLGE